MSETTAEYKIDNRADIQRHIEQACILGSFNRLRPIIEDIAEQKIG